MLGATQETDYVSNESENVVGCNTSFVFHFKFYFMNTLPIVSNNGFVYMLIKRTVS